MQRARFQSAGAALSFESFAPKAPGVGEIAVEIAACGLNFADLLFQKGTYQDMPDFPVTPGLEVAGRVSAVGAEVTALAPGDRVAVYCGAGGLATHGVFDASRAVRLPDALGWAEAAALQIAYGTSHLALTRRARLTAGETLLVLGAAGGVGLTAVEIGAQLGARVIAVARGAEKLEIARAAGAAELLDAETPDLRSAIKALGGADVAYDPVGGTAFQAAFRALRPEGRLLTIGFASGEVPQIPANHMMVKNIDVIGLYWGGYLRFAPEALTASLAELMSWAAEGRIRPHISHRLPLERAAEGLELLRSRAATGKVIIEVGDP